MPSPLPRPEYPRPDRVRERWQNLNGVWQFERDPGRSGVSRGLADPAKKLAGEIVVPFCPESRLSGIGDRDFMPGVWYRRKFRVPADWSGSRIMLHFGAVDYRTRVWVNGREVGTHRGGYVPFAFDVTDALDRGENDLAVFAEDDTRTGLQPSGKQSDRYESHGCHYTRTTGIWQTVWLEPVPEAHIVRLAITPDLSAGSFRIDVHTSAAAHGARVEIIATADGERAGRAEAPVVGNLARVDLTLAGVRAWSPEDPFLYDLAITLRDPNGGGTDIVTSYAGLRSLGIKGPALLFNGRPKFQRLVLDQGFYPDGIYTAPTDDDLRRDVEISRGLGFDGARLHMRVFEPRFLYWADRLGYLVWGEFPNWGLDHADPRALARHMTEWLAVLARDYSHPSIVGWCPFNETPTNQDPDLLRTVYRTTKLADPGRPCIDTSGYVHVETDVYDSHCYEQDPEKFAANFRPMIENGEAWRNFPRNDAPYAGQPYFVSEYGGIWWNPGQTDETAWGYGGRPRTETEYVERYRRLTEALLFHPRMCAFCYTQLYDIEQEVNGLYTYDRKPKLDPAVFAAINRQKAAIEV